MFRKGNMRLWLYIHGIILACILSGFAGGQAVAAMSFAISPAELAEFAAAAGAKVPEIQRARRLAENRYASLATYGSTSRELLLFVQGKAEALGSRDGFKLWLADQETLPLLAFHRLGTPLEFLLIPRARNNSLARADELKSVGKAIQEELPGNIFYTKPKVALSTELPNLGLSHYEAWEHIVLTERGAERLPGLGVIANGQEINLSDWGIRQFASETLIFLKNAAPGLPVKPNAEEDLAQVIRWIAAQSAYPSLNVPEASKTQLRELLMRTQLLPGVNKLLGKENKASRALAELQEASPDPARTRALLDDYGITALARTGGLEQKIRSPLPLRPASEEEGEGEALGEEITFLRRVPLAYAQALSHGALYQESLNGGPAGFYLSANSDALSANDIYLEFTVPATAKAGRDFTRFEDYFVLLHRDALAKNADGSLKISVVDHDFLVKQQTERLRQLKTANAPAAETLPVQQALGSLLDPLRNTKDAKAFRELWAINGGDRLGNGPLLDTLLSRSEMLRESFATSDPFWRALLSRLRMEAKEETVAAAAVKAYSVKESPSVIRQLPMGSRARAALLAYPETLAQVREKEPIFWGNFLDGLVEDKSFRASYLSGDLSHPTDIAFLRRMSAHPELSRGLAAPVLTAAQAANLEMFDGSTVEQLLEASLTAGAPLPRALNPARPADLALLQKRAGTAPDAWSHIDWLGRGILDGASIKELKNHYPELWAKVLSDSLLSNYPGPAAVQPYQFDASAEDQAAIHQFLVSSAKDFGPEPTLDKAFLQPQLMAQPLFRQALLAEFPALAKEVPVHRLKIYAERLLGDEPALDIVFAVMREKAKNAADLMAMVDPDLKEVNFPSEAAKAAYLARLQAIAGAEEKRYLALAKSPFQKDAWQELVQSLGAPLPTAAPSSNRMPASLAPGRR